MRISLASLLLLAASPALGATTEPAPPTTRPIAAVWFEPSGMRILAPGEKVEIQRLIVGVWGDGTVVWSDDRATGGAPYRIAKVDPKFVATLKESLAAAGLFDPPKVSAFGPDASITVIAADLGDGKKRRLGSWHEPARDNPLLVIDQNGIYAIKPGELKPKPSPEYARFLEVWAESRRLIESLVPKEGPLVEKVDQSIFKLGR